MIPQSVNQVTETENQLQNWDNFCQYHLGDWHGIWTRYSPEGRSINSFKCVRSLHLSEDGSQITHQNNYTYPDGKTELQTFGPYIKPSSGLSFKGHHFVVLFLDSGFSWGSKTITASVPFFFETGFRHEKRRISLVVGYGESGELQRITVISEQLDNFPEEVSHASNLIRPDGGWKGIEKKMTPDLATSFLEKAVWQPLENLGGDNQVFHLPGGGSISCPLKIESNGITDLIVDWQAAPNKLLRGTRRFDHSEFSCFLLQVHESEMAG